MAELYQLTFADGKSYIGIAKTTAAKRFSRHCYNARQIDNPKFQSAKYIAWRTLGEPVMEVLAQGDLEHIVRLETEMIVARDLIRSGYNSCGGGGGVCRA